MVLWAFPFIASNGRVVASPITVAPAAFPDSMPDNESSKTKQFSGLTPIAFAPRRYGCGAFNAGFVKFADKPHGFDKRSIAHILFEAGDHIQYLLLDIFVRKICAEDFGQC